MPQYKKVFDVGTYAGVSGYTRVGIPTLRTPGSGGKQVPRSLRFRAANTAYLSRTSGTSTDQTKATLSFWMKAAPSISSVVQPAIWGNTSNNGIVAWNTTSYGGKLFVRTDATNDVLYTVLFKDPSVWQHIVITVDTTQATGSNRVKVYVNSILQTASSGTAALNSTNFNSSSTVFNIGRDIANNYYWDGYLAEYYFIDGSAIDPTSFGEYNSDNIWVPKAYSGSYGNNGFYLSFSDNSSVNGTGGTSAANVTYSAGFGGWTIVNSLNAIPAGTVVDAIGVYQTSAETADYAYIVQSNGANSFTVVASTASFNHSGSGLEFFKLSSPYTIPGSGTFYLAKYSSGGGLNWGHDSASSTSWQYYAGTVSGTQTWSTTSGGSGQPALIYRSNTGLTADNSGNKNFWYANNISLTAGTTYDSMYDSPTDYDNSVYGAGNYCTLNPLINGTLSTISEANLKASNTTGYDVVGTLWATTKCYYEYIITNTAAATTPVLGMGDPAIYLPATNNLQNVNGAFAVRKDGVVFVNGSNAGTYTSFTTGDIVGFAFDPATGKFWYHVNGVWVNSGNPTAGTGQAGTATVGYKYVPVINLGLSSAIVTLNCGQQPFRGVYVSGSGSSYTGTGAPPSGFSALNTKNITRPTDANMWFYGDTPDLMWIKNRSATADHSLTDTVRGVGLGLSSSSTAVEQGAQDVAEMNKFGMTLIGASSRTTAASNNFVYWAWKGGSSQSSIAVNAYGSTPSIASTVSANTSAGFSVVTYTGNQTAGATVGHGLGVAPSFIFVKCRGLATSWPVYHSAIGATNWLLLNGNQAQTTSAQEWNNTAPTSTVFSLGSSVSNSNQSSTYVAYCFTPISQYSSFGTFVGNDNADGPMVFTNFRPRYLLVKCSSSLGSWAIFDSSRGPYNVNTPILFSHVTDTEVTAYPEMDFLSNGFKVRANNTNSYINVPNATYIYAAFAEHPFKIARAR